MRLMLALFAPFFVPLLALPALTTPVAAQSVQRAELWNSEQFVIRSEILERDFLIQVAKPFGEVQGKVPAVYITDGNMLFSTAAGIVAAGAGKDSTGPAYYIGIGYPEQDRDVWLKERAAHLTHIDMKAKIPTGNGEQFAQFLIRELRPEIERRYPVDPTRRVLLGYSFGGLFGTHMLLDHPDAFDTYLLGSPSIWVEPALLERAKAFAATAPKRVFIAIGGEEKPFMRARELYDALNRPGNGVTAQYWSVPDENHMTVPPAFLARALRFAVPPPPEEPKAPPETSTGKE